MTDRKVWMAMLAKLTAPHDAPKAAAALVAYLPMMQDFPDEAFTVDSLSHVARGAKFLPTYAVLRDALVVWWQEHRPRPLALPISASEGWTDEDESWLRYWKLRSGENFAPVSGMQRVPGGASPRQHCASLIRAKSPRAWARISA